MQEYRAYPAPQPQGTTPDASNRNKSKTTPTLAPPPLAGRIGSPPTSSYSNRIPLPGSVNYSVGANSISNKAMVPPNTTSTTTTGNNKMGSPNLPPPTKKLRAVAPFSLNTIINSPNGTNVSATPRASPPSYVDEKIAQRRAQLQSLKAKSGPSSNASAILARAKAVTTANINGIKHNYAPGQMNGNAAPAPVPKVILAPVAAAVKANAALKEPPLAPEGSSSKRLTLQALRMAAASPPKKIDEDENVNGTTNANATATATATAAATTMKKGPTAAATSPATAALVGNLVKQKKDGNINGNGNGNGTGKVASPVVATVKETEGTKKEAQLDVQKSDVATATGDVHVSQESKTPSTQLELTKRLRLAQQEKEQAMQRMAELESQVMNMKFQQKASSPIASSLERDGRGMERDGPRGRGRRRMKSPEPRRDGTDPLKDLNVASRAVETVEEIFMSPLAKFVVRKPYGGDELKDYCFVEEHETENADDNANENEDGSYPHPPVEWAESVECYWKNSNVKAEKSLEVMAMVEADGSILHIHGDACRHGLPVIGDNGSITGYEFKTFADVESMDGALGKVIFIDSEGNDGEYWLDPIYEEALKIRESYCSNVFSAALALASAPEPVAARMTSPTANGIGHAVDNAPPTIMMPPASSPAPVAVDASASVNKDEPKIKENVDQKQSVPQKEAPKEMEKPKKQQEKEQPQLDDNGSTDILSFFFIWFFSTIFKIVWFILMIPVRVVNCTLTIGIVVSIVHLLWLYFADNRDAIDMGALMSNKFNIN